VFVGNLSFDTSSDEVRTLFSEVAEVASVVLPTDRISGRPRGFAFVEFAEDDHAKAAIQKFDGFELGGRKLRVNEASERPARGPSMGFTGGGGFGNDDRPRPPRPKGSRRNIRSRKRSIW
jgi:RNA recognition motif-containing protein